MTRLFKAFNTIFLIGTNNTSIILEKGAIKLINVISFIIVIVLILISTIKLSNGITGPTNYFNLIFGSLFMLPIILNYFNKSEAAKYTLLLLLLIAIFSGTFIIKFGENFHFTIIVPITMYFMLFYDFKGLKFKLLIAIVLLYVLTSDYTALDIIHKLSFDEVLNIVILTMVIAVYIYSQIFFLKRIKSSETKLKDQICYEKALSKFTQLILKNEDNCIEQGLKIIMDEAKVSRIYIFENSADNKFINQKYEVCADGVNPEINNPMLQNIPYDTPEIARWVEYFFENKIISGPVKDFPEIEKQVLEVQGIKSILAIPLFSNGFWRGFIGFDDVETERIWKSKDINLLRTMADIIGIQMGRNEFQQKIIEQNTELQELIASKDKFFSIVAHDIKSPFNSLIGFSNLLMEELQENNYENVVEYSSIINNNLLHTFEYLSNLLEWSRLKTNKIEFAPSSFNLYNTVKKATEVTSVQAKAKNIDLVNLIQETMIITADKYMIKTVLINLISNAIKFSNQNSKVNIYCENGINELTVFVKDYGVGMDEEKCNSLFNINESKSTPGTNNETGTGLGLILCKEFINTHKGKIAVKSTINEGSSFYFSIPHQQYQS